MQFPSGSFSIRMIRGVFWVGRRLEKGEVLRVPQDINRQTAIRWCTRRKPFAVLVEPEQNAGVQAPEAPEVQDAVQEKPVAVFSTADEVALESLSYRQLQALAKERGIRTVGVSKAELIAALRDE